MKVNSSVKPVKFIGEKGEQVMLRYSNMGEPYRDGVDFNIDCDNDYFGAFLEVSEIRRMSDFLNEYLGRKSYEVGYSEGMSSATADLRLVIETLSLPFDAEAMSELNPVRKMGEIIKRRGEYHEKTV